MASAVMICFRAPPEMRRSVDEFVTANGIGLSEWYRDLTSQALLGGGLSPGDGYRQGRQIAFELTKLLLLGALDGAFQTMPETVEEGLAQLAAIRATYASPAMVNGEAAEPTPDEVVADLDPEMHPLDVPPIDPYER